MTQRKAAARPPRQPDKRDAPRRAERESPRAAHRATPQARADDDAGGPALAMQPHLALMKKTARRHTNQANAGAGLLLLWLADDIERRVNVPLTELGLSESKLGVLMFFGLVERGLVDGKVVTPSYMAEYFGVTRSTVTGLLDWLEKRDLLVRALSADDRRSFSLALTDAGRALLERALPVFWDSCEALVACLDETERAALQRILAKVWRHLK